MEITSTGSLGDSLLAALPKAQNLRSLIIKKAEVPIDAVTKALSCCPQLEVAEFDHVKINSMIHPPWPQLDSLVSLRIGLSGPYSSLVLNLVCSFQARETPHPAFLPSYFVLDGGIDFSLKLPF
jgi:hypothetical protein